MQQSAIKQKRNFGRFRTVQDEGVSTTRLPSETSIMARMAGKLNGVNPDNHTQWAGIHSKKSIFGTNVFAVTQLLNSLWRGHTAYVNVFNTSLLIRPQASWQTLHVQRQSFTNLSECFSNNAYSLNRFERALMAAYFSPLRVSRLRLP